MATLDHRALNEVLWRYPERIRQLDLVVDGAQLHPSYGANIAAWRSMAAQALLEKARIGELEDPAPRLASSGADDIEETMESIAELLYDHAQLRRRGTA